MGTATLIKRKDGNGEGRVYRLDPPVSYHDWNEEEGQAERSTEYVWVSAAVVPFSGPETYIFPSDKNGKVLDWGELHGSYRGGLNHERALANAGYEAV